MALPAAVTKRWMVYPMTVKLLYFTVSVNNSSEYAFSKRINPYSTFTCKGVNS